MYEKYGKRLLDIIFSLILLPLVLLVILLCGVLIKLEDRGPIFYCSERLGKHGKVFKMYKLRTMKVNAPDLRNPYGLQQARRSDYQEDKSRDTCRYRRSYVQL